MEQRYPELPSIVEISPDVKASLHSQQNTEMPDQLSRMFVVLVRVKIFAIIISEKRPELANIKKC